jgi:hypothetical protein
MSIAGLLEIVGKILEGAETPSLAFSQLSREILLPLHRPNSWSLWDRQEPLLADYHKPLVFCIHQILRNHGELLGEVFSEIFKHFPPPAQANTAKDLLLYTELEGLLDFPEISSFFDEKLVGILMNRVITALRSENAQTIQAVLQLWKKPLISEISARFKSSIFREIIPALFRGGQPHWNPTVIHFFRDSKFPG